MPARQTSRCHCAKCVKTATMGRNVLTAAVHVPTIPGATRPVDTVLPAASPGTKHPTVGKPVIRGDTGSTVVRSAATARPTGFVRRRPEAATSVREITPYLCVKSVSAVTMGMLVPARAAPAPPTPPV